MRGHKPTLLILGGTGEAACLARAAEARFGAELRLITSLAGRTRAPGDIVGEVRVGGFGGADGLARFIRECAADWLIDASHPFAAQISKHACLAAAATATPRLALLRPPWRAREGDRWREGPDMAWAAAEIPALGRRVFLTVGARSLEYFAALREIWFLVRLIDAPAGELPLKRAELVLGRGPFDAASEQRLLEKHRIDLLVTRASGGAATRGKIDAARALGLPIVMVRRPPPPPGETAESIEAALDWLGHGLAG